MKSAAIAAFILCLVASASLLAAEPDLFSFPEGAKGRRMAAYFAAFNASDEKRMKIFLEENLTAEALQHDSVEQRLMRFRSFKKQAVEFRPERVLRDDAVAVSILARDGKGQLLECVFQFGEGPDARIARILVMPISPEDVAELTGPALSREEVMSRIAALINDQSKADLFSGTVLVAFKGQVVLLEARGLASVEYGAANRTDTRFNLGSINKLFTRVAIGQLAEKGRLSPDDTLGKFLPDYPNREAAEKVTVRQLLDMTSGIGDFFGVRYADTPKDRIRVLSDYLPLFASEPLLFPPGSDRRYSNGGYVVLGLIVEKASGQSYYDYVLENIYKPAGMTSTSHLDADVPAPNVASGYTHFWGQEDHPGERRRNNIYSRPVRGSSAGGGYSTAQDLYRFAEALRAGKLLGPANNEWFAGPQAYAGGAPGINAELDIDTVPGWIIVVLSNYDPPAAENLAQKINILLRRME